MSLLLLRDLELHLGDFNLQISLALDQQVTGLFGPSGAGKTTLLEIIAGLRRPEKGKVQIGEEVLFDATSRRFLAPEHRHIGYVPQDLALFPHMTVRQNLTFGPRHNPEKAAFKSILQTLQLDPLLSRYPANLSGGEKQRVAVGRALMTRPRLLLLDEPLASLDSELKTQMSALLKNTIESFRIPALYVTHDPAELAGLCDHILLLRHGKIEAEGSFHELFQKDEQVHYTLR